MIVFGLILSVAPMFAADGTGIRKLASDPTVAFQSAHYQLEKEAVISSGLESFLPQLIIGGEWSATIKLTNIGTEPVPTSLAFFIDSSGDLLSTTFQTTDGDVVTDVGFEYRINPGGIVESTFFGGEETTFGHVFIPSTECFERDCRIYAEVTLRNRNPTRPDFESVFQLEEATDLQYMMWDHRNGLTSVLYIVNGNTTPTDVSIEVRNASNQLIDTIQLPMAGGEARIMVLHAEVAGTIGLQGTLVIRGTNQEGSFPFVVASALRINPSNSFTPIRAVGR